MSEATTETPSLDALLSTLNSTKSAAADAKTAYEAAAKNLAAKIDPRTTFDNELRAASKDFPGLSHGSEAMNKILGALKKTGNIETVGSIPGVTTDELNSVIGLVKKHASPELDALKNVHAAHTAAQTAHTEADAAFKKAVAPMLPPPSPETTHVSAKAEGEAARETRHADRERLRRRRARRDRFEEDGYEKSDIRPGEPSFRRGKLEFHGEYHPERNMVRGELNEAQGAVLGILKKHESKLVEELRAEFPHKKAAIEKAIAVVKNSTSSKGGLKALDSPKEYGIDSKIAGDIQDFLSERAKRSYPEYREAAKRMREIENEIRAEQFAKVKGMDIEKIEGYTESRADDIRKAIGKLGKSSGKDGLFGIFESEGLAAAVEHNVGEAAFKKSSVKALGKLGIAFAGGAAVIDAAARDTTTDVSGEKRQRTWVERVLEGGAGIAGLAGSLLPGRR